jgi:hypothetical protein
MSEIEHRGMSRVRGIAVAVGLVCVLGGAPSIAGTIDWTDWTTINVGNPGGSAQGTLTASGQPTVMINYSGDVESPSQTSDPGNFNYWLPTSTFTSATVSDAPTNPGIVTLNGGTVVNTLTFSQAIVDPVMALLSLGQGGVQITYTFSAPFTILSGGPSQSFGGSSVYQLASNIVGGEEGNGTIQFTGTFTSLSWTVGGQEFWHGFTIGIAGVAPVPEPSSFVLGSIGVVGVGGLVMRTRRRPGPRR